MYGWYFRQLPWPIDTAQCVTWSGCTLLYGGIAPKAPPARDRASLVAEQQLITSVNLPLNLDQNRQHDFHQQLTQVRADARMAARTLPVVST